MVILTANDESNNPFYSTQYFVIDGLNDSILQVNLIPHFQNLTKGNYKAYAVNYKTRDSIFNLEKGKVISEIQSNCLTLSIPFSFSVCATPTLSNLETSNLELCADGTQLLLTDSLIPMDEDGALDTFSIIATILESPDLVNDYLSVDLAAYPTIQQSLNRPALLIEGINSLTQVQAILRTIYFYSNSMQGGNRTIQFQISDGKNESNTLSRMIIVLPLPDQPVGIFRKKSGGN